MSKIEIDHGHHGPKPKFDGDVWTISYRCSNCGLHTNIVPRCSGCGEDFYNYEEMLEFSNIVKNSIDF